MISNLTSEIICIILNYFSNKCICNFRLISKHFNEIMTTEYSPHYLKKLIICSEIPKYNIYFSRINEIYYSHSKKEAVILKFIKKLKKLEKITLNNEKYSDKFVSILSKYKSLSFSHLTVEQINMLRNIPELEIKKPIIVSEKISDEFCKLDKINSKKLSIVIDDKYNPGNIDITISEEKIINILSNVEELTIDSTLLYIIDYIPKLTKLKKLTFTIGNIIVIPDGFKWPPNITHLTIQATRITIGGLLPDTLIYLDITDCKCFNPIKSPNLKYLIASTVLIDTKVTQNLTHITADKFSADPTNIFLKYICVKEKCEKNILEYMKDIECIELLNILDFNDLRILTGVKKIIVHCKNQHDFDNLIDLFTDVNISDDNIYGECSPFDNNVSKYNSGTLGFLDVNTNAYNSDYCSTDFEDISFGLYDTIFNSTKKNSVLNTVDINALNKYVIEKLNHPNNESTPNEEKKRKVYYNNIFNITETKAKILLSSEIKKRKIEEKSHINDKYLHSIYNIKTTNFTRAKYDFMKKTFLFRSIDITFRNSKCIIEWIK